MPEKTPRDPQPAPHDLILESRARLTVTGVQKVLPWKRARARCT